MKTIKRDKGIKGKPTSDINTCNELKYYQELKENVEGHMSNIRIILNKIKDNQYNALDLNSCLMSLENIKNYIMLTPCEPQK